VPRILSIALSVLFTIGFVARVHAGGLSEEILAKYGNSSGELDSAGMRRLLHDVRATKKHAAKRYPDRSDPSPAPVPAKIEVPKDLPTISDRFVSDSCSPAPKSLYVRSDPLDDFHYMVEQPRTADAKGASLSYTNNFISSSQNLTVNGRVSYVMLGLDCTPAFGSDPTKPFLKALAVAPFVSANGTWTDPSGKTPTNMALKGGVDFQFGYVMPEWTREFPFIERSYFYVSPYYQTDNQGLAHIGGTTLAWEPVAPLLWLDSGPVFPLFSFFWQFRGEADFVTVQNHGLTNLVNSRYNWVGETTRVNVGLFPVVANNQWPEWLGGRISVIATAQYFYDTNSGTDAKYYSATVSYKLGQCKKDNTKSADLPCTIQGSSALSFEYDWGTNKDTLVATKQYLLKLSYAY